MAHLVRLAVVCALLLGGILALASPEVVLGRPHDDHLVTMIVEMEQPPLLEAVPRKLRSDRQRARERKPLDVKSAEAQDHLATVDESHRLFSRDLFRLVPEANVKRRFKVVLNGLAVTLPATKVEKLRQVPGVKGVSPSRKFQPALDASVPLINAPILWTRLGGTSQAGAGMKIAILDTGIDETNPFLADASLVPPPGFPRGDSAHTTNKVIVARLYAPSSLRGTLGIEHGHGTHVAGIAAGVAGYNTGTRTISGSAPKAFLMNYKVLLGTSGYGETPEIIQAIEDAVADGADVVNMSFGDQPNSVADQPLFAAIRNGTRAGVVFVAAAGNSGSAPGTLLSPGVSPDVITVGATDKFDNLAYFNSRGPSADLAIKPDVVAPGVAILSSWPSSLGSQFKSLSGTSMSAPHAAGAAALLMQLNPSWTPEQVKSALVNTAKIPVFDSSSDAMVMERGGGRLDLQRAMDPGLTLDPPSYSFGVVNVAPGGANLPKSFTAANLSGTVAAWSISVTQVTTAVGLLVSVPTTSIGVPANGTATFNVVLSGTPSTPQGDYEGYITLQSEAKVLRIPYFVRVTHHPYVSRFPLVVNNAVVP